MIGMTFPIHYICTISANLEFFEIRAEINVRKGRRDKCAKKDVTTFFPATDSLNFIEIKVFYFLIQRIELIGAHASFMV